MIIKLQTFIVFFINFKYSFSDNIHKRFEYKYSFKTPYIAQRDNSVPFWDYWGSAIATDDRFRITPSLKSQKGQAWSKFQTTFASWEVEIFFRISGQRMGADGLAFWFTDRIPPKNLESKEYPVFGSVDRWNGFGLFFDSFDNDNRQNNPYVLGMVNDGSKAFNHDGDGFDQKLSGCVRDFRNKPFPVRAKIEYYKNTLTVLYHGGASESDDGYELCFQAQNVFLPSQGYFGISGATGGMADDQDVFKFLVHSLSPALAGEKLRETEEQLRYQREFEQFESEAKRRREEYLAKNPDAARKAEEQQYLTPEQRSFNQLMSVISQLGHGVKECLSKLDSVIGKQEHTITLVSGGIPQPSIGSRDSAATGQPLSADATGSLLTGQREIANEVRYLKSSVSDVQSLSQQILSRAQGSVQQVGGSGSGGSYEMHVTLKELNEGLNMLKRDVEMLARARVAQGVQQCPQVTCASTWVVVLLLVIQVAILVGYLKYRDSREAQTKKFY